MQLSKAAAIFFQNYDQLESLGISLVQDAIDPSDVNNERLEELLKVFATLEEKREEASQNRDRLEGMCALFGLLGVGSMLSKVIHEVLTEREEGASDE